MSAFLALLAFTLGLAILAAVLAACGLLRGTLALGRPRPRKPP